MKKKSKILSILKWIAVVILLSFTLFFVVRAIGKAIYNQTPAEGINESMYIDVNGTKQWISIYGEDIDNPVLLYLHGGPGSSTSHLDYVITRKWADVYTVVTWDQRNCGKSYSKDQKDVTLTKELFITDGKEVTEYVLDYLSKDKLTILGHSWGSIYGANLVQEYPEYYECFIGTGQLVDCLENEEAFKQEAYIWAQNDEEMLKLVEQLTPDNATVDHFSVKNSIMQKYGYDMMANGADYNLISTMIFNPYYSISDWIKFFNTDMSAYLDFYSSDEFASFSLKEKIDYQVPFYNINGDKDYQTNYELAQEYYEEVNAPYKQIFIMKNMTHGLLESDSEGFSEIVHQIAEIESNDSYTDVAVGDETWGVTLTAENVTPTSLTIKCTQSGGEPTGELQTGSWYILETWTQEEGWHEDSSHAEVCWTDEAWIISKDSVTEWKVNWEWLYGALSEGKYRIGKEIMDFRGTGDYDKAIYFAEFEILK